jgi:dipeptidase E
MSRTIVAIGGGVIHTRGTLAIDREILRLTKKKHPRLLFIPTASSDSARYWRRVQQHFKNFLKCRTDVLFLLNNPPSPAQIRAKINAANVISVGGGNTLMMMRVWRRFGLPKLLKAAYLRGTVLSGISAGSICWFDSGHSDSMSFYNPKKWDYINVRGLGLIKGIHCPHYNTMTRNVPRRKSFRQMIQKIGGAGPSGTGIAIENNCAIVFQNNSYRVIRSNSYARAYILHKLRARVITRQLRPSPRFSPLSSLYRLSSSAFGGALRRRYLSIKQRAVIPNQIGVCAEGEESAF